MNRKAPWIAVMAFTAFSAGAIAAEDSSYSDTRNAIEEGLPGRDVPEDTYGPTSSSNEAQSNNDIRSNDTQALDDGAPSSIESRGPTSSAHSSATAPSFAQADRDGNGVLDAAEANAAGIDYFAAMQDEDSLISVAEYYGAVELMSRESPGERN